MRTNIRSIAALLCASLFTITAFAQQTETPYTTYSRYDERGLLLGTISANTASGRLATRNYYDDSGRLTIVEKGNLSQFPLETTLPQNWAGFTLTSKQTIGYDDYARKTTETLYDNNGKALSLTQTNYNPADGHVLCKAVRMNKDYYSSLPDACSPTPIGPNGPDRISKFSYNSRDLLVTEVRGLGDSGKAPNNYVTNTYESVYLKTQTDANNNKTTLYYDSNARLQRVEYPVTTKGAYASNPSDYVQFSYDNNGNKLTERKRSGDTVTYKYDANNRMTVKHYSNTNANTTATSDVCYVYDNRGLQTESHFVNSEDPSTCKSGIGLSNTYDGVGNILSATTNQSGTAQTINYTYDLNNNRETISHPDNVTFKYAFDGINRVAGVANDGSAANSLVAVNYGVSGKRSSITRNGSSGATTEFNFDNGVQLKQFTQNLGSATDNLTNSFVYNAANQVTQLTESNSSYSYIGNNDRTGDYTTNGLNQYKKIDTVLLDYDGNQNLKYDGMVYYYYDSENRLTKITKLDDTSYGADFVYDPNGRLFQYTIRSNGVKHQYLYDNNALVVEYVSGSIDKRYVHGDQVDEPWAMYTGATVSSANLSYLHTNHQGSIIAYTNSSGAVTNKLAYDAYGIPASMNMGTFGYTGQIYLKDVGLYYYKARIYSPTLGRFLQMDPIGYKDDMDLYSYVGNDPLNKTDPTGLIGDCVKPVTGQGSICGSKGSSSESESKSKGGFAPPIAAAATQAVSTTTAAGTEAAAATSFSLAPLAAATVGVLGMAYSHPIGDGTLGNRQMMFHYSPMQTLLGPLRPNSFLTPTFGYSSKEAVSKLALDASKANTQLYIHSFLVSPGEYRAAPYSILGTNTAAPLNNQPGGGTEFISTVPLTPIGPSVPAPGPY